MSEALAVRDEADALMPVSMGTTFHAYKAMQTEIDKAMPDQIMTIQGRQFRKKGYWRAVRAAFSLKVWCVSEERIEAGGEWGYSALYRAEGRNGMSADGDGVCMATEKAERQRTVHNVRSHAHTRAFNRAVSNLVGFGEVSAEEVERDDYTVVEAQVVRPAPVVAPAETVPFDSAPGSHDLDPGSLVTKVSKKTGTGPKGDYAVYFVTMSNGAEGSTFDGQLGVAAEAAMAAKQPVFATFQKSGKYNNLISLVRAS